MNWHNLPRKWTAVAQEVMGHAFIIIIFLACIRMIEVVIQLLWWGEPIIFGFLPLSYVIHGIDLATLLAFGFAGIKSALRAYNDEL